MQTTDIFKSRLMPRVHPTSSRPADSPVRKVLASNFCTSPSPKLVSSWLQNNRRPLEIFTWFEIIVAILKCVFLASKFRSVDANAHKFNRAKHSPDWQLRRQVNTPQIPKRICTGRGANPGERTDGWVLYPLRALDHCADNKQAAVPDVMRRENSKPVRLP